MKLRGVLAGLGVIILAGCSGQSAGEATTSASPSTTTTSSPAPTTKSPTTKPTPTTSAPPQTVSFLVTCSVAGKTLTFSDYRSAQAAESDRCEGQTKLGTVYTDQQRQAVAAAYGGNIDNLDTLYAICAAKNTFYATKILSPEQAKEAQGALILCPDHPRAADIQTQLDLFNGKIVASSSVAAAEASGTRVSDGSYLIGKDIEPGSWQSVGERVTDCYWELSDAQGNIIDNNFISIAPQFTLEVPSSASGFTVRGCSFERLGG